MQGENRRWRPTRVGTIVLAVGVCTTAVVALSASVAHRDNEDRLIRQRTREAGAVLEAAVPGIEGPLVTSSALADVVNEANSAVFRSMLGSQVGPERRFISASVWPIDGIEPTVTLGQKPRLADRPAKEIRAYFARSVASRTMVVFDLLDADPPGLGYAFTVPGGKARYLVYAEQMLPGDRTSVDQADSAFSGLHYALYLGPSERRSSLLAASTDRLPLGGRRAVTEVGLGDATLRLVMAPTGDLGGSLLARLPWLASAAGLVTAVGAAVLSERLQRGRLVAESLARENDRLYTEQRAGSQLLQSSLLPRSLPAVPGVEIVVRYAAGVVGTDVGGDWYDVVSVDGGAVIVVGDVSGRGLAAASVMASVRYTMRTLAVQGIGPGEILATTNRVIDDGGPITHFATAICGAVDLDQRTVTFAAAGHPRPLLITDAGAEWVDVGVGPPLGIGSRDAYRQATVAIPRHATLLLVTDGLFERRQEPIDTGLERLRTAAAAAHGALDVMVDSLYNELTGGTAADDTAILALRWET